MTLYFKPPVSNSGALVWGSRVDSFPPAGSFFIVIYALPLILRAAGRLNIEACPSRVCEAPGAGYARTGEWENGERNADCQEDQQ